jgi:hypothetical protein
VKSIGISGSVYTYVGIERSTHFLDSPVAVCQLLVLGGELPSVGPVAMSLLRVKLIMPSMRCAWRREWRWNIWRSHSRLWQCLCSRYCLAGVFIVALLRSLPCRMLCCGRWPGFLDPWPLDPGPLVFGAASSERQTGCVVRIDLPSVALRS